MWGNDWEDLREITYVWNVHIQQAILSTSPRALENNEKEQDAYLSLKYCDKHDQESEKCKTLKMFKIAWDQITDSGWKKQLKNRLRVWSTPKRLIKPVKCTL